MTLNENAQATLLLTAYFSKPAKGAAKPLTPTEWGKFALWLRDHQLSPAKLLSPNPAEFLEGWQDTKITTGRILELLRRGNAMALALEKWSRAGIWVLTRSDAAYPKRLKKQLRDNAPPVLFGCGNTNLLNQGGIAVVGSRNVPDNDLEFVKALGSKAASDGITVVSGGARGVDETSMLAAGEAEGKVIGILADSLLKAATSSKWRRGLMDQNLVLVSPFYPEAGFNAGNAMARNKYIYCMADAAVVVHSGATGGTWSGALENLKKRWVPLWVKPTEDREAGNAEIVNNGGRWCEAEANQLNFTSLFEAQYDPVDEKPAQSQSSFFDSSDAPTDAPESDSLAEDMAQEEQENLVVESEARDQSETDPSLETEAVTQSTNADSTVEAAPLDKATEETTPSDVCGSESDALVEEEKPTGSPAKEQTGPQGPVDFFELFLVEMHRVAGSDALAVDQICEQLGLHKSQVNDWLKRAVEQGVIEKLSRPVRYRWSEDAINENQLDMLTE